MVGASLRSSGCQANATSSINHEMTSLQQKVKINLN
jgi:hypothetical protein